MNVKSISLKTVSLLHSKIIVWFCFISLFFSSPSFAWPGKVVHIADGDTITVLHDGQEEKIRLYGIDCPEKSQAFGNRAKQMTASLVAGRKIDIEPITTDKYKRTVALVSVDGQSLNKALIHLGFAWVFTKYCKESFCTEWKEEETAAKTEKRGMWADPHIISPWDYRHNGQNTEKQERQEFINSVLGDYKAPQSSAPEIDSQPSGTGSTYRCDGRTRCSQMTSCEEAKFFLQNCPGVKMDGNHDGIPCERQWCH